MQPELRIEFSYQREEETNLPLVTDVCVSFDGVDYFGSAICHDLDMPIKEIGRKLALERAIAPLPKTVRRAIWEHYHARKLG